MVGLNGAMTLWTVFFVACASASSMRASGASSCTSGSLSAHSAGSVRPCSSQLTRMSLCSASMALHGRMTPVFWFLRQGLHGSGGTAFFTPMLCR